MDAARVHRARQKSALVRTVTFTVRTLAVKDVTAWDTMAASCMLILLVHGKREGQEEHALQQGL